MKKHFLQILNFSLIFSLPAVAEKLGLECGHKTGVEQPKGVS